MQRKIFVKNHFQSKRPQRSTALATRNSHIIVATYAKRKNRLFDYCYVNTQVFIKSKNSAFLQKHCQ